MNWKKRKKIKIGHKSFSTYIYNIFFKRERERERATWRKHWHFCQSRKNSFPISFLSILGRKHFGGLGEIKTPKPYHLFSFLPTQPNTFQKNFSSYFISKVFHPPYFPSKQTHPKSLDSSLKIILWSNWIEN